MICAPNSAGTVCSATPGLPSPEICDGMDNDCNGIVDDGCNCINGQTRSCQYSGPAGTENIGSCKAGTQACSNGQWGTCSGEVLPSPELCDGIDNNCDGRVDEGFNVGGSCTVGVGSCRRDGVLACSADRTGIVCSATPGLPSPEICDGIDNDCNGLTDDNIAPVACSSGIGACKRDGQKVCINGAWGECDAVPGIPAAREICLNKIDDNCDGIIDEGCDCDSTKECCKDNVNVGSSVNMATGNLSHIQTLYKTTKAVLPLELSLIYNSLEDDGPLGKGWTHSYNMSVAEGSDGGYIYTQQNSRKIALAPGGSQYKPLDLEYPALTLNLDGTSALKRDENTTYTFNAAGRLTAMQDRFSNSIAFTYTGSNLTGLTDSQGRTFTLAYNAANRIEMITDPNNNIHTFTYTGNNLMNVSTQTPDARTLSWAYTYTPQGQMQTKTSPMGYTITYAYLNNRLSQVTDDENRTRTLSFDPLTAASVISVGADGQWIYAYDHATGKLASKRDPEGYTTTYAYGPNIETVTDAKGNISEYLYDSRRNILSLTEKSATDQIGRTTAYTYNADNEIVTVTDPENHVTTYSYSTENNERIVKVRDAANEETETRYYADGRIKSIKNAKNQTTAYTYSFDQNTKKTTETSTDFLGVSTSRIYDLSGNMIESRDAFNTPTKYEYNSLNQLMSVKDNLDRVLTMYDYWADGNIRTATDANGNAAHYAYNYDGKITEVKDALGNTTTYVYGGGAGCSSCGGSQDNLTSVTDANNKTTTYAYYKNGWKKSETDPLHHVTTYTYDGSGLMTSLTDAAMAVTAFDKTDLVMTKTDPLGRVTTYEYDKAGRLKTKTDRKGDVIRYTYTLNNLPATISYPDNSTVAFTRDELGRTTSMTDSLGTTTYLYDDANRTVTVTDAHGFTVVYKNDEVGRLKEITYPGSRKVMYGYDKLNRMETVTLDWLNQTATYRYDAVGRLASLTNFNGTVTTYGYDNANRLTSLENRKSDNTIIAAYSFPILDGVGNRMQAEISEPLGPVAAPESLNYSYNEKKNRLLTAGTDTFTHDNEGQIASKGAETYTFDYEHRLTAISGTDSAQYSYDGSGSRLKAVRNGETTYYIHDMSSNVLAEADGNKSITKLYIHGQGLLAMVTATDQVYSYHYNAIGSTASMTDQNQNVVNAYSYNSFGRIMNQIETVPQPFKYVGLYGVMAEPNGFYYMRARYYDPKVGRFVSEDPIGFAGGTVNLFEYVGGNPVNRIDPLGLDSYRCTKPLDALSWTGAKGAKTGPDIWGNPLYHQYLCTKDPDSGQIICGGQTYKHGEGIKFFGIEFPYGPGSPSNDIYKKENCTQVSNNDCIDSCVLRSIKSATRPYYGLKGAGINCQEWSEQTFSGCVQQCWGGN